MQDWMKKMMLFGVGLAALTREKTEEFVKELVKKGELSETEGKQLIHDLVEKSKKVTRDLETKTEEMVTATLRRLNIPTRKEMDELKERIAKLEKRGE
ncbi:MAG TPA: phasin family protein [Syntrophales bacterium]|jgi:polyhydroxyalkanoate synthesis regulator phasin|nr:phasin family protein [Syntrophales bacterium]HRT61370.1 phasin family protein [Syntrophales bacterium]